MTERIELAAADIERLGTKLDGLDLTPDEQSLMMAVFDAARRALAAEAAGEREPAEVGGYSFSFGASLSQGFQGAVQPLAAFKGGLSVGANRIMVMGGNTQFYD